MTRYRSAGQATEAARGRNAVSLTLCLLLILSLAFSVSPLRLGADEERESLIDILTVTALRSKLAIRQLDCDRPIVRDAAATLTAVQSAPTSDAIRLEGAYADALRFLNTLATSSPNVVVTRLSISQIEDGADRYRIEVTARVDR